MVPLYIAQKRLFIDKNTSGKPTPVATTTVPSRPLLDKTPFPNRTRSDLTAFQTPLPATKLAFLEPGYDGSPLLFPRPSSTRKHIRVPRSASRSFETPPSRTLNVQPNHNSPWDVSELDICLGQDQSSIVDDALAKEDHDELEYMPPRPVGVCLRIYSSHTTHNAHCAALRSPVYPSIRLRTP